MEGAGRERDPEGLNWSEIAHYVYQHGRPAGQPATNLRYVFGTNIANDDTKRIATELFEGLGQPKSLITTPQQNAEGFYELLGSENGSGPAYLIIDHGVLYGVNEVAQIALYKTYGSDYNIVLTFA